MQTESIINPQFETCPRRDSTGGPGRGFACKVSRQSVPFQQLELGGLLQFHESYHQIQGGGLHQEILSSDLWLLVRYPSVPEVLFCEAASDPSSDITGDDTSERVTIEISW